MKDNCKKLFCEGCQGKKFELHKRKNSEMIEIVCTDCDSRLVKFPDTVLKDFGNEITEESI